MTWMIRAFRQHEMDETGELEVQRHLIGDACRVLGCRPKRGDIGGADLAQFFSGDGPDSLWKRYRADTPRQAVPPPSAGRAVRRRQTPPNGWPTFAQPGGAGARHADNEKPAGRTDRQRSRRAAIRSAVKTSRIRFIALRAFASL